MRALEDMGEEEQRPGAAEEESDREGVVVLSHLTSMGNGGWPFILFNHELFFFLLRFLFYLLYYLFH